MHLHYAVMLLVMTILGTVHAALQRGYLGSSDLDRGNGLVRKQALESDNDIEERSGADLLYHVVTESASKSMQRVLGRVWTGKREPSEDVRTSLHLEEVRAVEILKHRPWENDVEFARKRKKRVAVMKALTTRFGDSALASKIIRLKGVKSKILRKLAIKAQSTQVYIWKVDVVPPKDVFCFLELDEVPKLKTIETTLQEEVASLFKNAEFETWTNYVHGIHGDDDRKAEKTMVKTLTIFYGDERLSKILSTAARTETEAVHLQAAQLACWLEKEVDPAQVRAWISIERQMTKREKVLLGKYNQDFYHMYPVARRARSR